MGNFFNFLPNQHNAFGFDVDSKAVSVARHLYPNAVIDKCDIQQYKPDQRFDIVIGNPPFNLKFDNQLSQFYYMNKAHEVLSPAGFLMVIVPTSFLQNEFWEKTRVEAINRDFSFIGQARLSPDIFASVGVENFNTKIMVFMRESQHIEMKAYCADEFVSLEELGKRIAEAKQLKTRLRVNLMRETNSMDKEELESFEYKLSKYLYELKAHKHLQKHLDKAVALVAKFRNQRPPKDATYEQREEWEKNKLTTAEVLGVIRRYITRQNVVPRKEIALVKTSYGFKLKQYAPRLLDKIKHQEASLNDLILGRERLPMPAECTRANLRQIKMAKKLIARKQRQYEIQEQAFSEMEQDPMLAFHLNKQRFINKDYEVCEFTSLQKQDLNLVLQKRYSLLNWQQGSGKTAAVYTYAKYLLRYGKVRNAVILAPAIATNMTWEPFLRINKVEYRLIRKISDLEDVLPMYI